MKLEKEIIAGCIKGERKAQELLYRNYYETMVTLCMRYTKSEADAVEVLNNGFLKVLIHIRKYDPSKASLYIWIRSIVINACLDFLKVKQKKSLHAELDEAAEIHIDADAITKMTAEEVLYLVRQLPPATQVVFNLFVMDGYSHNEIAALLNISVGTSRWHLSEARKNLQHMIRIQEVKI